MASFTLLEKSSFLASPAFSSFEQAKATSTSVALPVANAKLQRCVSVQAVASLDRKALETKPLGLLRAMARQKGLRGNTKEELINSLSGVSAKPAAAAAVSNDDAFLQSKSLSELREIAKSKGLRGDTKAEIIKLLQSVGVSAAPASSAPVVGASVVYSEAALETITPVVVVSVSDYEKRLQVKPMSKLRAVARQHGIYGNTRAELVAGLLAHHEKALHVDAPSAVVQAHAEDKEEIVDQLESLPLSELRALAKARGVRGDTRAELIKLLTTAAKPKAAAPKPAFTNGAVASAYVDPAPVNWSAAPKLTARDLQTKSLAQLRAMAAQRGVRGVTKQELVAALSS